MTESQLVDRIAWRRARAATAMAVVFVAAQAVSFGDEVPMNRPQALHLAAWLVWSAALVVFLAWGGGLLKGARVRSLLNDESTRDHRRSAFALGFWVALATAVLLYATSWYEPVTAREATRLIITFPIAAALLRFGMLERRALRDG